MRSRDLLRSATAELHERLDGRLGTLDLARTADYGRFLAAQAAALLPMELGLEQAGIRRLVPDWDRRTRRAAIQADLQELGLVVSPLDQPLPALETHEHIFGALYVLEGSRLGGEVLLRRVLATAGPEITTATRFLAHGRGERLWVSFLAMLEQLPVQDDGHGLVQAAQATFVLFDRAAQQALAGLTTA